MNGFLIEHPKLAGSYHQNGQLILTWLGPTGYTTEVLDCSEPEAVEIVEAIENNDGHRLPERRTTAAHQQKPTACDR